jgi:HK97 family phage major capsid protein
MQLDQKYFQSRFSSDEIAATQRLCGDFLTRNKIDLDEIDFHGSDWNTLCGASREAGRELSRIIELRHGDKPDPAAALALGVLQEVREEIEATKTAQRAPMAHMRPIPPDGEVRGGFEGGDYEGEEVSVSLKPEQRFSDWAARSGPSRGGSEYRGLTTGGLLKAMVLGPKTEAERRALSEGTDSAGGFTVPDALSATMIDRMRRQSVVIRAGARTIPLTSDVNNIAKVLTDPVPAWRAENAEITSSDATFGRVQMLPKSLAVLCRVSRELLEDSLNMGTVLPDIIAKAMGAEVDRMCLFGSGSGAEPTGVTLLSGINEVELNGALSSHSNGFYGSLIEARRLLLDANSGQPTAYVMNPREDETLIAALTGDGYPMPAPPKIAAISQLVTTAVPKNGGVGTNESSIVFGDFTRMLLGVRNSLRIEVLKERYADYHQYAFIAHLRATVAVEHVLAFGHVTGITPEA